MGLRQFTNNAQTTLAAGISAGATSLSVAAGTGSLFPALTGTQFFTATLIKANTPTVFEIILCTARATDSFTTIVRAQEGTTALAWNAGDTVALLPTAAALNGLAQATDVQAQVGNYAIDTGSANAYAVVLTPALTAHQQGMPIRFMAGHTNTGGSTFNDGFGAASLLTPEGVALMAGEVAAGGIYEVFWSGANFQLNGVHAISFSQLVGVITASQVPQAAVTQYAPQLFASPTLTGTPVGPTAAAGTSSTELATTAFANPGASLAADGWEEHANGSYDQWGVVAYNGSGASLSITFPKPFPSVCWNVVCAVSVGGFNAGVSGSPGTNGWVADTTQLQGTALLIYWRAKGR